jgi:predicted RNase H-like HicB family nuclease
MQALHYYDGLPWDIRIERDLRRDGTVYYIARHPEFGDIAGPLGTGNSPEAAIAELHEARRSLITGLRECGAPVPEPGPVKTAVA